MGSRPEPEDRYVRSNNASARRGQRGTAFPVPGRPIQYPSTLPPPYEEESQAFPGYGPPPGQASSLHPSSPTPTYHSEAPYNPMYHRTYGSGPEHGDGQYLSAYDTPPDRSGPPRAMRPDFHAQRDRSWQQRQDDNSATNLLRINYDQQSMASAAAAAAERPTSIAYRIGSQQAEQNLAAQEQQRRRQQQQQFSYQTPGPSQLQPQQANRQSRAPNQQQWDALSPQQQQQWLQTLSPDQRRHYLRQQQSQRQAEDDEDDENAEVDEEE